MGELLRQVVVTLETVTPLFLGGANPRGEPELRPASFRGALRFWFRALLGGVLGDNPKKVFEWESKIFGDTTHASPLAITIKGPPKLQVVGYSQLVQNKSGLAYLLFSARRIKKGESERKAIEQNTSFDLVLRLRNPQDQEALEASLAALWLLTHLGGLGSRSRRGAGNLQVKQVQGANAEGLPSLVVEAQTPEGLCKELSQGLSQLRQWAVKKFQESSTANVNNPSLFDVLHPQVCNVWVVNKEFNDWQEALNQFGETMRRFRRSQDYIQRAVFGLPIVFQHRNHTLEGSEHVRRASPLIVRVVRLKSGKCALVLTLFSSQFLPPNEKLRLRDRQKEIPLPQPMGIIEEFLTSISQESELLGVSFHE